MDGEWSIGARLVYAIFGAIFGALFILFNDWYFSLPGTYTVDWMLVGIAGAAAVVGLILGFLFGPKFFEFFE